jgi:hypothetical protein
VRKENYAITRTLAIKVLVMLLNDFTGVLSLVSNSLASTGTAAQNEGTTEQAGVFPPGSDNDSQGYPQVIHRGSG